VKPNDIFHFTYLIQYQMYGTSNAFPAPLPSHSNCLPYPPAPMLPCSTCLTPLPQLPPPSVVLLSYPFLLSPLHDLTPEQAHPIGQQCSWVGEHEYDPLEVGCSEVGFIYSVG